MTDKKQKIEQLWVVEGDSGRYVKVIRQGRKWLYLEPRYRWDKPRVSVSEVAARGANVATWSDRILVRAYLSEEARRREIRRKALLLALTNAFERWARHDGFSLEGLEVAAKALGIEVKDG